MLGMMNCPTSENLDFYAVSPAARRQIHGSGDNLTTPAVAGKGGPDEFVATSSADLAAEQLNTDECPGTLQKQRSSSNAMEIFCAVKQKPKISYMEDGRRLVDGKLANGHSTPEKLWNRLIVGSVTTKKFRHDGNGGSATKMEVTGQEMDEAKADHGKKRRFSIGSLLPSVLSQSTSTKGWQSIQ